MILGLVRQVGPAMAVAAAVGCGTNDPDLPPGLLDAIAGSGAGGGDYPSGPYGTREGEVARDLCFRGWRDPTAAGFDTSKMEEICFADFYDPDGSKGVAALMVNTAAIWCTACKTEWGGSSTRPSLSEEAARRADRGFRVLGTLFEDAENNSATPDDVALWAETFEVSIPFAGDPDFLMGAFADRTIQPFNMVLDARTMEIVAQVNGDQPSVLYAEVDALLDERSP